MFRIGTPAAYVSFASCVSPACRPVGIHPRATRLTVTPRTPPPTIPHHLHPGPHPPPPPPPHTPSPPPIPPPPLTRRPLPPPLHDLPHPRSRLGRAAKIIPRPPRPPRAQRHRNRRP